MTYKNPNALMSTEKLSENIDDPNIVIKQLDLESLESIKRFAEDIATSEQRIDALILNAGIMAVPTLEYTKSGFERQIGVNHLGHFYLQESARP